MKNVVSDRGSFTVEAAINSVFIIVIVTSLLLFIFFMYDLNRINSYVNNILLDVNEKLENEKLTRKEVMLETKKNMQYWKDNNNLIYICINDIDCYFIEDEVCVEMIYMIKDKNINLLKNVLDKKYYIRRKMRIFNVKKDVISKCHML